MEHILWVRYYSKHWGYSIQQNWLKSLPSESSHLSGRKWTIHKKNVSQRAKNTIEKSGVRKKGEQRVEGALFFILGWSGETSLRSEIKQRLEGNKIFNHVRCQIKSIGLEVRTYLTCSKPLQLGSKLSEVNKELIGRR